MQWSEPGPDDCCNVSKPNWSSVIQPIKPHLQNLTGDQQRVFWFQGLPDNLRRSACTPSRFTRPNLVVIWIC